MNNNRDQEQSWAAGRNPIGNRWRSVQSVGAQRRVSVFSRPGAAAFRAVRISSRRLFSLRGPTAHTCSARGSLSSS